MEFEQQIAELEAAIRRGEGVRAVEMARRLAAAAPADPAVVRLLALAHSATRQWAEALAEWERLPADPAVLVNRAAALGRLDRLEEAVETLDRAIRLAPRLAVAHFNRGNLLGRLGRFDAALDAYGRALRLAPDDLDVLGNRGNLLSRLGRDGAALDDYARALALRPDHAPTRLAMAFCRLRQGDFAQGWADYEWRLPERVRADPRRWRGAPSVAGRTILLHAEQGFGDSIQFLRYVPMVAALGARVVLVVPPALAALAATLRPAVPVIARGRPLPPFDLHSPLGSLPAAFGTRPATVPAAVPYLHVPLDRALAWRARLETLLPTAGGPRVGIAWAGNPANPIDRDRSMPLAALLPLAAAGLRLVSLQKAPGPVEAAMLGRAGIPSLGPELGDFLDTAAAIEALDLTVSVETGVAHLAGALGCPVWIALSHAADWRWLAGRADSPWYPTARLFRQDRFGDWAGVVRRMAAAGSAGVSLRASRAAGGRSRD